MAYYNNNKYGITVDALKTKIKCEPCGAYLFFGEEEYLKSFYLDKLRELVDKGGFAQLDYSKLDFENKTIDDLASEFFVMPMGGEVRLLEVRNLLPMKLSDKDFAKLVELVEEIPDYLIFVIYCRNSEYSVCFLKIFLILCNTHKFNVTLLLHFAKVMKCLPPFVRFLL